MTNREGSIDMAGSIQLGDIPDTRLKVTGSSSRPFQRVKQISPQILELVPSPVGLLIFGGSLVAGGIVATFLLFGLTELSWELAILPLVGVIGGIGVLGGCVIAQVGGTRIRFDRNRREITLSGVRFSPSVTLSFSDVGAIQLCYAGSEELTNSFRPTTIYQFNLVLNGSPLVRLNLLQCGNLKSMRKLAGAAAEFLNVPLVEHRCSTLIR